MAENGSRPTPEKPIKKFHAWVQSVGIIIGSVIVFLWGVTAFFYEKVWLPKSAPVNITLDFVLQKSGIGDVNALKKPNTLIPVEFKVSAKNPGIRTVNLLPSIFIIYGIKITPTNDNDKDMVECLNKIKFDYNSNIFVNKYSSDDPERSVVAVGNLLCYDYLFPSEVESRSYVFYIPQGQYDVLRAYAFIPTAKDTKQTKIDYNFEIKDGNLKPTHSFFGIDQQGKRVPLKRDKYGEYDKGLEIQAAETTQMISLW